MEQLKNNIIIVISYIDQYCSLKIIGRNEMADKCIPVITAMLKEIIPEIIKSAEKERLLTEQDPGIWVMLLKNIVDAISGDDDFIKIDMFEYMAEYLKYYLTVLETENE